MSRDLRIAVIDKNPLRAARRPARGRAHERRGDGRLTGAVLFGDTADGLWYLNLIRSGADVSHWRDILAFGPALALPQAA